MVYDVFFPAVFLAATITIVFGVEQLALRGHAMPRFVDVVTMTNNAYAMGVAAAINSSRVLSSSHNIRFFIGYDGDAKEFYNFLDCVRVNATDVIVRSPKPLMDSVDLPKSTITSHDATRLSSNVNYARFTLPLTFPEVSVAWYIDSDVLPLGDLAGDEYTRFVHSGAAIQAVGRKGTIASEFNEAIMPMYHARYNKTFSFDAPSWNAGIWMADFSQWSNRSIAEEAIYWVQQSKAFNALGVGTLWKLNTQPIMYLLFHEDATNQSQMLPELWNCESIHVGYATNATQGCHMLHWNGPVKPWHNAQAKGHAQWAAYLPRYRHRECAEILNRQFNHTQMLHDADSIPENHTSTLEDDVAWGHLVRKPMEIRRNKSISKRRKAPRNASSLAAVFNSSSLNQTWVEDADPHRRWHQQELDGSSETLSASSAYSSLLTPLTLTLLIVPFLLAMVLGMCL